MKHKDALAWIRIAGFHDDKRAFTRLYVENRISFAVAQERFRAGAEARAAGVKCTCRDCNEGKEATT